MFTTKKQQNCSSKAYKTIFVLNLRLMKKRVKQILTHVLLLLFVSYYGSITLFWHSHHLGNTTIVHSHPFSNTQHSHTAAQYDLIKVLTETVGFIGVGGLIVALALKAKSHLFALESIYKRLQQCTVVCHRRGPPACQFA